MPERGTTDDRLLRIELKLENQSARLDKVEHTVADHARSVTDVREDHDLLISMNTKMDSMDTLLKTYVTRTEFSPVRLISFGLVAVSLTAVLLSVIVSALKPHVGAP